MRARGSQYRSRCVCFQVLAGRCSCRGAGPACRRAGASACAPLTSADATRDQPRSPRPAEDAQGRQKRERGVEMRLWRHLAVSTSGTRVSFSPSCIYPVTPLRTFCLRLMVFGESRYLLLLSEGVPTGGPGFRLTLQTSDAAKNLHMCCNCPMTAALCPRHQ